MDQELERLKASLKERGQEHDPKRLEEVYRHVEEKHRHQVRKTGDPVTSHLLFVANTVSDWGLDQLSIEASLLHELPALSETSLTEIEKKFGKEIHTLVNQIHRVNQVRLRGSRNQQFLENIQKMFVAMAKDIRVVLISLANRLHDISTLDAVPLSKQKRIALETLEVYAPLADRLGMGVLKGDLEDLAFPYVYKEEHDWLVSIAKPHFMYSEDNISDTINRIRSQISKHHIEARTEHRLKRKYSLYKKLMRPEIKKDISRVYDLMAVRVITKDLDACYATLGVIHQYWKPVPFLGISDFIAQPKPNGYQSIHTKVFDHRGNVVEIQIRSEQMHLQAEFGAAAHFLYTKAKSEGATDSQLEAGTAFKKRPETTWVDQLAVWQNQILSGNTSFSDYKLDALSHRIYVFSPKGDVYDLPEKATPIDYAFNVHSDLGSFVQSVKVNNRMVSVDSELKSGDVIEIIKTKLPRLPSKNWLRFVKTAKARLEIKKLLEKSKVE